MPVTFRVTNEAARSLGTNSRKVFSEEGGTIGRAPGNDWVLPDPQRYLSGRHAAVYCRDGVWFLADTSANGVFLNGAEDPIGSDQPVRLADGDRLQLGDYDILVEVVSSEAGTGAGSDRFETIEGAGAMSDPLELLGRAAAAPVAGSAPAPGPAPAPAPPRAERRPAAPSPLISDPIPESLDPLELLGGGEPAPRPAPGPPPGAQGDHSPLLEGSFRPPGAVVSMLAIPDDLDLDDLLGPSAPGPVPAESAPPLRESRPAAPRPGPSSAPPAPIPSPVATSSPTTSGDDAGLRAFLEGAGIDPGQMGERVDSEFARLLGRLFRQVMADLRETLMARAELKSGFRMDVTMIRARENNPLKFSAGGVDEALENLLFSRGRGYLSAERAVGEGFQDIKDHQVAMMAGMRASFEALLRRFDPRELERTFEERARRGSLLSNRKARNWELFEEYHGEVMREAEDDFQVLYGQAFADAYQAQIDKLQRARVKASRQ